MLRSVCCNARVLGIMSRDFLGDDVKTMTIGTWYFRCTVCDKACDAEEVRTLCWKCGKEEAIEDAMLAAPYPVFYEMCPVCAKCKNKVSDLKW